MFLQTGPMLWKWRHMYIIGRTFNQRSVSRPECRTSNNAVSPDPTDGRLLCVTTRPTVGRVLCPTTCLTVGSPLTVTSRSESQTSHYGNYTSDSRLYTYSIVSFLCPKRSSPLIYIPPKPSYQLLVAGIF